MKNIMTAEQKQIEEKNEGTAYSDSALEFKDIIVYNEMAEQTSVKLDLIGQIHLQLNQLEEITYRRQFMMKEILQLVVD